MSTKQDPKQNPDPTGGEESLFEYEGFKSRLGLEVQGIGRPSEFTQEVADALCEHLENGGSLRKFCEVDENPSKTTVLRWLRNSAAFRAQYADARARGMDAMADELIEIADNSGLDVLGVNPKTGQPIVDGEAIARARLRFDARRWLMSKLAPKKYGDKVELEHTGEQKHTITFRRG